MLYLVIHCTFVLFSLVLVAAAAIIVANKRLLLVVGCGVVGVGLFFSLVLTGTTLFYRHFVRRKTVRLIVATYRRSKEIK